MERARRIRVGESRSTYRPRVLSSVQDRNTACQRHLEDQGLVVAVDVHILIMNEDSSPSAYEALRHLVRRICQLLCQELKTQHLVFSPTPEELQGCVRAGQWQ